MEKVAYAGPMQTEIIKIEKTHRDHRAAPNWAVRLAAASDIIPQLFAKPATAPIRCEAIFETWAAATRPGSHALAT